jgi:hypothetical protein
MLVAAEHTIDYGWLSPHLLSHPPCYGMLGTWQEIRYTLMTFGLPVEAFPIKHVRRR